MQAATYLAVTHPRKTMRLVKRLLVIFKYVQYTEWNIDIVAHSPTYPADIDMNEAICVFSKDSPIDMNTFLNEWKGASSTKTFSW